MDFFNAVGDKLSSAGSAISDKAGLSATAKEEKAIREEMYKIGEMYYRLHENDYEPDFAPMMDVVKACKVRIDQIHEQQERERQEKEAQRAARAAAAAGPTIVCPACNAVIAADAKFCTACGTKIEAAIPPAPASEAASGNCSACGEPLEPGAKFCTNCGAQVG